MFLWASMNPFPDLYTGTFCSNCFNGLALNPALLRSRCRQNACDYSDNNSGESVHMHGLRTPIIHQFKWAFVSIFAQFVRILKNRERRKYLRLKSNYQRLLLSGERVTMLQL